MHYMANTYKGGRVFGLALAAAILLAPSAHAFSGESAAVTELMDFLLKKDLPDIMKELLLQEKEVLEKYEN